MVLQVRVPVDTTPADARRFLAYVDAETSGYSSYKNELLEVAALRVEWPSWRIVRPFYARLRPSQEVPADVAGKNGYTAEGWVDAVPLSRDLLADFGDLVAGADWVGSNPDFDEDFIGRARYKLDAPRFELASRQLVDVLSMGSPLRLTGRSASGNLDALGAVLGVGPDTAAAFARAHGLDVVAGGRVGHHTAMGDCCRVLLIHRILVGAFLDALGEFCSGPGMILLPAAWFDPARGLARSARLLPGQSDEFEGSEPSCHGPKEAEK